MCIFACICSVLLYYKMYLLVLNYFYVFQCSLLLREYVAAAVQFLLQIIKNTYRRSKQFSYEDYLQKQLNLHGI